MINASEYKGFSDNELIEHTVNGNQSAFTEIVRRYKTRVASTIFGMVGKCDEADDIGQEVFIRFYKNIRNFRGDAALSTYLTRIAINLSLNEIKRRKIKRFFSFNDITGSGNDLEFNDTGIRGAENKEIVQMAMQKLEAKYRTVLVLRLLDGYSTEETAKILNLPLGTVLSRLARAQKKLKEYLKPYMLEYER